MLNWLNKRITEISALAVVMIMAVLLGSVAWQGSNAVFNQKAKPYVVVIDPGHGGYDPGAVAAQAVYEKEITLQVSRRLQALLSGDGVKAVLTRDEDEDYVSDGVSGRKNKKRSDLDYRINMAAGIQADIFVSLHVNAVAKGNNSGAETFYYNLSAEGKRLAEAIQNELIGIPGMNRRVAKPGDYYVVKNTKMPAVIVELGYLSNSAERNKLQREDYQEELAVAIARGIARYFDAR